MLASGSWPYVCQSIAEVPKAALARIRPEILRHLGEQVSKIYPAFAHAFPLCTTAMEKHWGKPKLVCQEIRQSWISSLVLEGSQKNIFFNPVPIFVAIDGPEFDGYKAMLPTAWKELYRFFDSFGIIAGSVTAGDWINTPFNHASRLELEEYRVRIGCKKAVIREFEKKIDSVKFRCWMVTDAGDSLWLDEQRCDYKAYHIRADAFTDAYVLPNPEALLDKYLAHVVAGGLPNNFDFRETF